MVENNAIWVTDDGYLKIIYGERTREHSMVRKK
jgi:hypothetical protein